MTAKRIVRQALVFSVFPGLFAVMFLAGCSVKADLTFRPAQEVAATPVTATPPVIETPAEVTPERPALPIPATPPVTNTHGVVFPPADLAVKVGKTRYDFIAAELSANSSTLETLLPAPGLQLAVVRPKAGDPQVLPPATLLSTTLYYFSSLDSGMEQSEECGAGGLFTFVLPPDDRLVAPLTMQRSIQQTCLITGGMAADAKALICPNDADCQQHAIDFLLIDPSQDGSGTFYISNAPISPGGDERPAYCQWVCPSGGGVCVLIGC